jgi:hypothetical protein
MNQTEFSLRHPNAHHVTLDFDAEYDEVTGHVAQEVSERTAYDREKELKNEG